MYITFSMEDKLTSLEEQFSKLEKKFQECFQYIERLRAENKKLSLNIHLLEEENKRLQGIIKRYSLLESKIEIAKTKLKQLVKKISEAY